MVRFRVIVIRPKPVLAPHLHSTLGEEADSMLTQTVVWTQRMGHGSRAMAADVVKRVFLLDFAKIIGPQRRSSFSSGEAFDEQLFDRFWGLEFLPDIDADVLDVIQGLREDEWCSGQIDAIIAQGQDGSVPDGPVKP